MIDDLWHKEFTKATLGVEPNKGGGSGQNPVRGGTNYISESGKRIFCPEVQSKGLQRSGCGGGKPFGCQCGFRASCRGKLEG